METQSVSSIELMRQYNEAEMPQVQRDIEEERRRQIDLFTLPAEMMEAPALVICSVWPEILHSEPFHHGGIGRKIYTVDAGSPENPSYLIIKNTWDYITSQEGQGQKGYQQKTILAGSIALDVIRHWTGDHPGNRRGKKGVGIIRGEYNPNTRRVEATKNEIDELVKAQRGFLTYLVERMDAFWDSGQREKVSGSREARKAIKMLGLDINQHPWYRSKVQLYNDCPRCAEKISVNANFCKHCKSDLVEYYMDRNLTPNRDNWPKVREEMDRLSAIAEVDPTDPDSERPKSKRGR